MAMRFAVAIRNAMLDTLETQIGTSPTLEFRTGAKPANFTDADTGTVVATLVLPADWLAAAASGSKGMIGLWQDAAADAAGVVGHYRIKQGGINQSDGSVTITGGGGDITLDNDNVAAGQQVTITSFVLSL